MRGNRRLLSLLLVLAMAFAMAVPAMAAAPADSGEIVILHTNDVHTYIDKDLTYSRIAACKNSYENALLVDAGDHAQGTAYGSMDKGETVIKLMSAAGYDAATPGNHEFDYGMDGCMNLVKWAGFSYLSCNFYHEKDGVAGDPVMDSYKVFETGGKKVAFVGVTTPESFTKSTPAYFQDQNGNYIYGIAGGEDGSALYAAVQAAIDEASQEADYVIGLGHLGIDPANASDPWSSRAVISHTTGFDAFIDGHSHSIIEGEEVKDKAGNTVVLAQTGNYLDRLGRLTIAADGTITEEFLTAEDLAGIEPDADVKAMEDKWISQVNGMLNEKVASSEIDFTVNFPDTGKRAVRMAETNLGDLNADAYYWYCSTVAGVDCDLGLISGGSVRANADAGDWSYQTCKTINTFSNILCVVKTSGQSILDALEFGARFTDAQREKEGGFFQVAGLSFDLDVSIPDTTKTDDKSVWTGGPSEYRVTNVKVYDKKSGTYEPLDLKRTYAVASTDYILLNFGGGFNMFEGAENVRDGICEDYLALAAYVEAFGDTDGDGLANISTASSPLASYEGYLMNYESPTGSGRITILADTAQPEQPAEPAEAAEAEQPAQPAEPVQPAEPARSAEPEVPSEPQQPAAPAGSVTYVIVPGDSLWGIAQKLLDSGSRWSAIYEANRSTIQDPNFIRVGQVLVIPSK